MTDAVRQLGVGPVPVHGPAPAVLCSRCKKPPEAGNIGAGGVSKQILFGIEFGNGRCCSKAAVLRASAEEDCIICAVLCCAVLCCAVLAPFAQAPSCLSSVSELTKAASPPPAKRQASTDHAIETGHTVSPPSGGQPCESFVIVPVLCIPAP